MFSSSHSSEDDSIDLHHAHDHRAEATTRAHGMPRVYSSSSLHTIPEAESPLMDGPIPVSSHGTAATLATPPTTATASVPTPRAPFHTTSACGGSAAELGPTPLPRDRRSSHAHARDATVHYRTSKEPPVCLSHTTSAREWVRVNVGGTVFTTTLATLCADPDSLLCAMCAPLMTMTRAARPAPSSAIPAASTTTTTTTATTTANPHSSSTGGSGATSALGHATATAETTSSSANANNTRGSATHVDPTVAAPPGAAAERARRPSPPGTVSTSVAGGGESLSPHTTASLQADPDLIPLDADEHNNLLLDLDPEYFAPVLNYLRHGTLLIPASCNPRGVLAVATYLNVQGVVERLTPRTRVMPQYLFSWGSGANGELGTQRLTDSDAPTHFRMAPFGVRIVQVALGANYSIGLSERGDVYSVGNADWGQLGLGNPKLLDVNPANQANVQLVPRRIPLFERQPACSIAAGYAFAMAITAGHHVYFWGNNNHAQGGLGAEFLDPHFKKIDTPCLVRTLEGKHIVQVGCGSFFGLARSADGVVYSWGLVECTGLGTLEELRGRFAGTSVLGIALSNEGRSVVHTPQQIHFPAPRGASPGRITHMHAGQWHSGAINDRGELFTWGVGYQGRLGHGDKEPAYTPKQVGGALAGHWVVDVACGSFHTVALTDRGAVFCWGDNASGQCGLSPRQPPSATPEAVTSPCRVLGLEFIAGGVARGVSCGRQHTAIVLEGPQPGCWESCCQLDDFGQPRGLHRQVYVVGERLRMADRSGRTPHDPHTSSGPDGRAGAPHAGTRFAAPPPVYTLPTRVRGVGEASHVLRYPPHGISSPLHTHRGASEDAVALDLDDDDAAAVPATAFDSVVNLQFQRVPGLETLDVSRVVSGLHHTFVCAEAVRLARQPRPSDASPRAPFQTQTGTVSPDSGRPGRAAGAGASPLSTYWHNPETVTELDAYER